MTRSSDFAHRMHEDSRTHEWSVKATAVWINIWSSCRLNIDLFSSNAECLPSSTRRIDESLVRIPSSYIIAIKSVVRRTIKATLKSKSHWTENKQKLIYAAVLCETEQHYFLMSFTFTHTHRKHRHVASNQSKRMAMRLLLSQCCHDLLFFSCILLLGTPLTVWLRV